MPDIILRANGASRTVNTQSDTPLLYVLRNDLELNSAKFGCVMAQCGYCNRGIIMAARALHGANPTLSETQIQCALADNLSRCGSHHRIVRGLAASSANVKYSIKSNTYDNT